MKTVIIRSFLFSFLIVLITFLCRVLFKTESYLADVGGLSAFVTVFGTLYGIMAAFVVFEVWSQYNKTVHLIDQEALGLERLFRLSLYCRDLKLTELMRKIIDKYAQLVIKDGFKRLGSGERNNESSKAFREIAGVIRDIKFNDDHDQIVFDHIIAHYGDLSETRTERITQSLTRMPFLLKLFLYSSSFFALLIFVLMPFANLFYSFLTVGILAFVLAMIFQMIEDLDNPFVGFWNITTEPFVRAMKHIDEDY